ncbi:unnamed protein product [Mytilus coruscus]|uniref:Uncharacterized protein n=1 Tax=Mytilus coruscus TaxID=42192 RepID=A0A6J8A716_MYTCO|nr:unnamed protein product [Mytilus coruscus]
MWTKIPNDEINVVDICADETESQDATNSVLIKADKKQNCKCKLHVENQDQDVQVIIEKYALESSSSPSELGCGLVMKFQITDRNWETQCIVDNNNISMIITMSHVMTIRSLTVNGTLNPNEGYCIEIRKAIYDTTKNQLKLTCDNDDTITLTVGASIGGLVTIIVVIVMVCIYRRKHPKTTSKRGPAVNTDTDDYGLRDNVLYVSSEPSDTTKTQNNPEFSVDNDGNYSTVDLDEILPVDDSTGDYSSIDLVNLAPTESNINGSTNEKPIIAPKQLML